MDKKEAVLKEKSPYAKPDCLFCCNGSVYEAVYEEKNGHVPVAIRCCGNEACKEAALKVANDALEIIFSRK